MNESIPPIARNTVSFGALTPFLLISFGLAWGILALFIFLPEFATALFGNLTGQHPLFYLCVYSPAIAAVVLVARYGRAYGLRRFFSRVLLWRCSPWWYAFLLVGIPAVFYVGAALKGGLSGDLLPFDTLQALGTATLLSVIKGPVEEFGWRGFALPLLQQRFAPVWGGLILGGIWGFWHLPVFLLGGMQQSDWAFAPFLVGCLAISVIATALFNDSNGSILLSAAFHFMLMNPVFPEADPYDSYILVLLALSLLWKRRTVMFSRTGAYVDVVPPRPHSVTSSPAAASS
ncbi:MAG: CPBP family intramembrane metalloprotease [Bacteroidetes bacterium]|nr:CPBP family intramembrane metalloprotease [Bacteroidota bacterium]